MQTWNYSSSCIFDVYGLSCKISQLSSLELKGEVWLSGWSVEAGREFFHCCWMGRGLCLAVPIEFPSFLSRSLWSISWTCKWSSPMFLPPSWSKTKTSSLGNQFISSPNIRQFPGFGIGRIREWGRFFLWSIRVPRHHISSSFQGSGLHFWLLFVAQRQFSLPAVVKLANMGEKMP